MMIIKILNELAFLHTKIKVEIPVTANCYQLLVHMYRHFG